MRMSRSKTLEAILRLQYNETREDHRWACARCSCFLLHHETDFFYSFVFEECAERVDEFRVPEGQFLHERIVWYYDRERSPMESRNMGNGGVGFADRLSPRFFDLFPIPAAVQAIPHNQLRH